MPAPSRPSPASSRRPSRRALLVGLAALLGLALVGAVVVGVTGATSRKTPAADAFYEVPADVSSTPGVLLRFEPFSHEVPADAQAWRILYTTTTSTGKPAAASGIVVVAKAPSLVPRAVVAWAHEDTGSGRRCAPSLLAEPFTAGALPALQQVVDRGWALVAADYPGLGVAGKPSEDVDRARSVLDAVRAARSLADANVGPRTVLWGHGYGGAVALWAAQVQPAYAPDVPLRGTVATAPGAGSTASGLPAGCRAAGAPEAATDPGPGPLLIAQGDADAVVIPSAQQAYVGRLRQDGHQVEYRIYPGLDHRTLVGTGSALVPQLLSWTDDRFLAKRWAPAAG